MLLLQVALTWRQIEVSSVANRCLQRRCAVIRSWSSGTIERERKHRLTYQVAMVIPEIAKHALECVPRRQKHDLFATIPSWSPRLPFRKLAQPRRGFGNWNLLSLAFHKNFQICFWRRRQASCKELGCQHTTTRISARPLFSQFNHTTSMCSWFEQWAKPDQRSFVSKLLTWKQDATLSNEPNKKHDLGRPRMHKHDELSIHRSLSSLYLKHELSPLRYIRIRPTLRR